MTPYQGYQGYRRPRGESGFRVGKLLLIVVAVVLIYLIARAIFGGGKENNLNQLVNETSQDETNSGINATNLNAVNAVNANGANVNTQSTSTPAGERSTTFENCSNVYSRGSGERKEMTLTFNVGTTREGEIDAVIQALRAGNTPAAFFATGDVASENAELVQKISSAGFPIYNYGNSLIRFTDLPESGIQEQLTEADERITAVAGATSKPFFRPPFGSIDDVVLETVTGEGYCPVTWTVDALDWDSESTAASSRERVLSKAANGAIVLMQAGNSITAEILPDLIITLTQQGYSLVSLDTLLK
ncbi:MAG: polysaccharide deacetylase family protein [Parcubacteria group bacterium]